MSKGKTTKAAAERLFERAAHTIRYADDLAVALDTLRDFGIVVDGPKIYGRFKVLVDQENQLREIARQLADLDLIPVPDLTPTLAQEELERVRHEMSE